MKKYKVIFLDWNGTLSVSKFWGHWQEPRHEYHKYWDLIQKALFKDNMSLIDLWMRGEYSSEDITEMLAPILRVDAKRLLKELKISCQSMQYASDDILKMVSRLRKNDIKVVVATDNMDTFPRWTVPSLDLFNFFDDVLDSFTLKAMKVDTDENGNNKFFRDYFKRNPVDPKETLLIEDSLKKKEKIQRFGIEYWEIEYGGLVPALAKLVSG